VLACEGGGYTAAAIERVQGEETGVSQQIASYSEDMGRSRTRDYRLRLHRDRLNLCNACSNPVTVLSRQQGPPVKHNPSHAAQRKDSLLISLIVSQDSNVPRFRGYSSRPPNNNNKGPGPGLAYPCH
jgi:hypothetical protein